MVGKEDNLPSGYGRSESGWRGWAMLAHAVLMVAGLLFLLPLLWMASTSLKPLDQTMAFPPTWIPQATLAPLDGKETIVTKDQQVKETSVLVTVLEGPRRNSGACSHAVSCLNPELKRAPRTAYASRSFRAGAMSWIRRR